MWQQQVTMLRPLTVGERIDVAIKIVRANFLTLFKATAGIALLLAIIGELITVSISGSTTTINPTASSTSVPGLPTTDFASLLGAIVVTFAISLLASALATAITYVIVGNAYIGQPSNWKDAFSLGLRRMLSVLWVTILIFLAPLVVGFVIFLIVLAVAHVSGGLALAFGVLLGVAFIVAWIWWYVAASLGIATVMLEQKKGIPAIRRSIQLVRGSFFTCWGTQIVAGLLAGVVGFVVEVPFAIVITATGHNGVVTFIVSVIQNLIKFSVISAFSAAVIVVLTIDMRVRKEGFDIRLLADAMGKTPTASAMSFLGTQGSGPQGYGPPGYGPPGYGPPGYGAPGYGAPPYGPSGYGAPGYGPPQGPGYGPPAGPGYGAPQGPGYGPPAGPYNAPAAAPRPWGETSRQGPAPSDPILPDPGPSAPDGETDQGNGGANWGSGGTPQDDQGGTNWGDGDSSAPDEPGGGSGPPDW